MTNSYLLTLTISSNLKKPLFELITLSGWKNIIRMKTHVIFKLFYLLYTWNVYTHFKMQFKEVFVEWWQNFKKTIKFSNSLANNLSQYFVFLIIHRMNDDFIFMVFKFKNLFNVQYKRVQNDLRKKRNKDFLEIKKFQLISIACRRY
jgi:hypothetical protein